MPLLIFLVATALVAGLGAPASGQTELERARQRAQEAAEASDAARTRADEARGRAEAAATELEVAEGRLEEIDAELAAVNDRIAASEAELAVLDAQIRQLAAYRFVLEPRLDLGTVLTGADINAGLRARTLTRFAVLGTGDEIDRYRVITEDLARDRAQVEDLRDQQAVAVEETSAVADRLDTELGEMIAQLEEAEAQEAIFQQEVFWLEEEERRRLEEERRRRLEEERRRREAEEAARRATSTTAAPVTTEGGDGGTDNTDGSDDRSNDGSNDETDAPDTTVPTPELVSGGGIVCPVGGPTVFTDSWGAARSGGRGHKGVDMFAERGTPAVAPVSGTVVHRDNSVGGKSYWLFGDDGHSYYGTHLDSYVQDGVVSAGTVIGTVGNTGNARNASPHLHFEFHPNGGGAINPYPIARAACG